MVAAAVVSVFFWVLGSSLTWQNDLREKMGMEPPDALRLARILVIAFVTFAAAFLVGRLVASFFRLIRTLFYRVMPSRRTDLLDVLAVVSILFVVTRDGIVDRVVAALDESCEAAQSLFERAPPPPADPRKTGSAVPLVDWFNKRRLLEPIGNVPPAEAEANFYAAMETSEMAA